MKTLTTLTVAGVALLGFAACDSKAGSGGKGAAESKTEALEHKAEIAHKDAKVFAAEAAKEAIVTKAEAIVKADAEKKAVEEAAQKIRESGELTTKAPEEKAKETREQK